MLVIVPFVRLFVWICLSAVASLGLVSPGAANDSMSPLFFSWKKLTTFFGHHCRFYSFHSGVTPPPVWCHHAPIYLSDLVCPLFFVNSATKNILVPVSLPWRVSPWAVRPPFLPPPIVTPLFVCSRPTGPLSRSIFIKLHTQVDTAAILEELISVEGK